VMPVRQQNAADISLVHVSGMSARPSPRPPSLKSLHEFDLREVWCDLVKLLVLEVKNYEGRYGPIDFWHSETLINSVNVASHP
jgi:hypothetical protein